MVPRVTGCLSAGVLPVHDDRPFVGGNQVFVRTDFYLFKLKRVG